MPRQRQPLAAIGNPHDPLGMARLLDQFLEWLRVKNYSEQTILSRKKYIGFFVVWCDERGIVRPNEVAKPTVERYQRWLYHYRKKNGNPLTFRSQFNRLLPLRAWFKWLAQKNHVLYDPASALELPKLERRLPRHVLSASEADTVMNQPNVDDSLGLRDRAILETFYSTGIRRAELCNLLLYDIDREHGTLMVRLGKGKKDRVVPIGDRAVAWIDRYEQEVRPGLVMPDKSGDVLFLSNLGEPLQPDWLTLLVAKYVEAANIGKRGSCHLFRHTVATLMLEGGADIRFVQAMLGHAHLNTTAIYTQVSIKKLKDIHTATHPAKLKRTPTHEASDL